MNPAQQNQVAGNAAAALLWGEELGLNPFGALRSIYVVRGTPAMMTKAVVGLALSRGHRIWTELETDDTVTVVGHRAGEPDHLERVTYTRARAQAEGLTRNDQYRIRPRAMLWARAASVVAQRIAADILMGVPEDPADELADAKLEAEPGPIRPRRTPVRKVMEEVQPDSPGPEAGPSPGEPHSTDGPGMTPVPLPDVTPESDHEGVTTEEVTPVMEYMSGAQSKMMFALFNRLGVTEREHRMRYTADVIGREVETSRDLTRAEATAVIDALAREAEGVES
jgi:hypothetical protein